MSSSIKSHIDWNELFPLLPKAIRDSLLLEAVTLLSASTRKTRRTRRPLVGDNGSLNPQPNVQLPDSLRIWEESGDGHTLAAKGRHYRIISSKPPITKGEVKVFWEKLLDHKGDFVAYETILKMCGNHKKLAVNCVNYLWRTGRLEVAQGPEAKL